MLKYIFMIIFMTPCVLFNWMNLQISLILCMFMYMFDIGIFCHFECLYYGFSLDLMSYMLIMLTLWIGLLMLISSEEILSLNVYKNYFKLILILLILMLVMSFSTLNLFLFYIFFESSLIPTFLIILGWGYQSERVQAGIYLLMYTLVSSLPLLLMIFYFYNLSNFLMFFISLESFFYINVIIFMCMFTAFLVKLPMFLLHLWLPKAHVEAPVSGSMILAGVLLKLGGYGILRLVSIIFDLVTKYVFILIVLSLVGGVLISLCCLRQSDVKLLIAFSSVSHMGIMISGMLTMKSWGVCSSLNMMLAHGLCSSGLFFLANLCYDRVGSRSLYLVKGMLHFLPKISMWWFLFCALNMACPPSLNLLSEIGLINSIVSWSVSMMILLVFISFLVAGYSLYLFSFSQHGQFSYLIYSFHMSNIREYLILFMHWIPLNIFILESELFMDWL